MFEKSNLVTAMRILISNMAATDIEKMENDKFSNFDICDLFWEMRLNKQIFSPDLLIKA